MPFVYVPSRELFAAPRSLSCGYAEGGASGLTAICVDAGERAGRLEDARDHALGRAGIGGRDRRAGDGRDRGPVAGVAFFHKPWGGRTPEGERPGCLAVVLLG